MVKISAQSGHFSVLVLKVIVNFGFLNLFLDIWIQNPDPDSEYGSGSRIQAQIECGSNRIRIRNTGGEHELLLQLTDLMVETRATAAADYPDGGEHELLLQLTDLMVETRATAAADYPDGGEHELLLQLTDLMLEARATAAAD